VILFTGVKIIFNEYYLDNLFFSLGKNSWWCIMVAYDTLAEVKKNIQGIFGFFQKDLDLLVQYDVLY